MDGRTTVHYSSPYAPVRAISKIYSLWPSAILKHLYHGLTILEKYRSRCLLLLYPVPFHLLCLLRVRWRHGFARGWLVDT